MKKEDPNMSAYNTKHLIIEKMPKIYTWEKIASSANGARKTGCVHIEELNESYIYHLGQN